MYKFCDRIRIRISFISVWTSKRDENVAPCAWAKKSEVFRSTTLVTRTWLLVGWLVGEKFVELRGRGLHKDGASTPLGQSKLGPSRAQFSRLAETCPTGPTVKGSTAQVGWLEESLLSNAGGGFHRSRPDHRAVVGSWLRPYSGTYR